MRHGSSQIFARDEFVSVAAGLALLALCAELVGCEAPTCARGFVYEAGHCQPIPRSDAGSEPEDAGKARDAGAPSTDGDQDAAALDASSGPADAGSEPHTPCGLLSFFEDRDRDGHGSPTRRVDACTAPPGYVALGDDCDDTCAECKPGGSGSCTAARADFSCITRCGTTGVGTCTSTCELNCVAPEEVCNYQDDDCDGAPDEGLRKLSVSPFREQASVRTWLFAQGKHPLSFVQLPASPVDGRSELRARRMHADGTLDDADAAIMSVALGSSEYALAALDDKIVVVWGESYPTDPAKSALRARILDRASLSDVAAPRTIATADTIRFPVAAATSNGVLVVFSEADAVARVMTDGALENATMVERFEASQRGRAHVITESRSRSWLVAYPASSGPSTTDLYLQALSPEGTLLGPPSNATQSRAMEESSPWLAEDGAGNVALTFHDQGTGGLNLLLFQSTDFPGKPLTPITSIAVSSRAGTCTTDACRSSSVAWTSGYWTVLFASEDDSHGHTIQARMFGARGALGADGSSPLTLAKDAGEVFAPSAATLASGISAFVTSAGPSTRYARWGCF